MKHILLRGIKYGIVLAGISLLVVGLLYLPTGISYPIFDNLGPLGDCILGYGAILIYLPSLIASFAGFRSFSDGGPFAFVEEPLGEVIGILGVLFLFIIIGTIFSFFVAGIEKIFSKKTP